jgi:hypothetical protein
MTSFLGAFPFLRDAPAVLGLEQMVIVITILTERYKRVLARGPADRRKLLFKSLAVYDRTLSEIDHERPQDLKSTDQAETGNGVRSHATGFAVDEAGEDEDDEADDDDLVLAAFDSLNSLDAFKHGNRATIHGSMIPADNFRKLVMLLLLVAPLEADESLAQHRNRTTGKELETLRSATDSIIAAFLNVEKSPGIKYRHWEAIIPTSLPNLFAGFNPLFEHFLFSKNIDFSRATKDNEKPNVAPSMPLQPLLQETGSILNLALLSQLSFFLPGATLFRRLRLLYSGAEDGFSMGSFETKVFNWRAPTILLVRGSRLGNIPSGGQEIAFAESLPPQRFPRGSAEGTLTFGCYISQPWRLTNKDCFGDADCVLFQLEPVHDVFSASTLVHDYVAFSKPSSANPHAGISFGCPPPLGSASYRRESVVRLGAVSLMLDSSFEYGVFTHDHTGGGGSFRSSVARRLDFQDRFEVEALEVWGCGGDTEAKAQAERWAWEAREAEARRKINLGTGDIDADRALMEMAGLIGANRSGGSMG